MSSNYRVDRIVELPATSAFNLTDLIEKINDPSGNPDCQKGTLADLITLIEAEIGGGGGGGAWGSITGTLSDQTDLQAALDAKQASLGFVKSYVALLSQSGTAAPTATVLFNTLGGTPAWARIGVGAYTATLASAFTLNKTAVFTGGADSALDLPLFLTMGRASSSIMKVEAFNSSGSPAVLADDILFNTSIEIRVYP